MSRSFSSFRAAFFLSAALLMAIELRGQNVGNLPWWNSPVVNDLGLSSEQTQKIRQIVHSHRSQLLDARNNANKATGDLDDIFNDPKVDPKQAKQTINRVAAARAESSRVFLEMSLQLRSVLTIEQWRALRRRWDEIRKKRAIDTQVPP